MHKTYWIAPNTSHRRVNGVPLRDLGRFVYFSCERTLALTRGVPRPRTTEQSPAAQHPRQPPGSAICPLGTRTAHCTVATPMQVFDVVSFIITHAFVDARKYLQVSKPNSRASRAPYLRHTQVRIRLKTKIYFLNFFSTYSGL